MNNRASIEHLKVKHAMLDALIREEENYIYKNLKKIRELKLEKLKQKDAIIKADFLS